MPVSSEALNTKLTNLADINMLVLVTVGMQSNHDVRKERH